MAAPLVFPPPPLTVGQDYAAPNGVTYTWDGEAWVAGVGSAVPLWTDNATSGLMSPVPAGRSLALSSDTAVHFGDPAAACPCLEADGDNLTLEVRGACTVVVNDVVVATVTSDGLAVSGKLVAPAGGDLAGAFPNPTLRAGVIPASLPPSGAAGGDLAGSSYPAPVIAPGQVTAAKLAPGVIPTVPTTLPPSGAAGGDLAGSSYPAPVVAPGAITAAKLAAGVLPTSLPPSGAAGGDLQGSSYPNPTIKAAAVTLAKMAPGAATGASQSETRSSQSIAIGATEATLYTKAITTSNGGGLHVTAGVTVLLPAAAGDVTHTLTLRLKLDGTTVATLAPGGFTQLKGNGAAWSPTLVHFAAGLAPGAHTISVTGQDTSGTATFAAISFVALETA